MIEEDVQYPVQTINSVKYVRDNIIQNHQFSNEQQQHLDNVLKYFEEQKDPDNLNYHRLNNFDRLSDKHSISNDHQLRITQTQINWFPLMATTLLICLSSFIKGYVSVQSSIIIDTSHPISHGALNNRFDLAHLKSLIPSASLIGASIGSLSMLFYPSLKYGRKTILLLSNIPVLIGCILCMCTISPTMIIIAFILEGIGFGISSVAAPVLLMELAPTSMRTFITLFHQLFVIFGILCTSLSALTFINMNNGWKWITSILIIIPIIQLIFYKQIPESPRWLIANYIRRNIDKKDKNQIVNRELLDQAKQIIYSYFVNKDEAEREYEDIYLYFKNNPNIVAKNDTLSNNIRQIGEMSDFLRPLFIGMTWNMFQQWTGPNFVLYRSQSVLFNTGGQNIYYYVFALYLSTFIATIFVVFCAKPNGIKNKIMIYGGTIIMFLSLIFLGIIDLNYNDGNSNQNTMALVSIAKLSFYLMGFAISLGAYVCIVNCELFPFCHRIRFGSICVFIQWSTNAALSFCLGSLLNLLEFGRTNYTDGNSYAHLYFAFSIMVVFCIGFVRFFIPETKNQSLETAVKKYNVAGGVVFVT